jgi:hypothetical protein
VIVHPTPTLKNDHVLFKFGQGQRARNLSHRLISKGRTLWYDCNVIAHWLDDKRCWVLYSPRDNLARLTRHVVRNLKTAGKQPVWTGDLTNLCKNCKQMDEDHAGAPCAQSDLKCLFDVTTFVPINPMEI